MPDTPKTEPTLRRRLDRFRRNILSEMELRAASTAREVLQIAVDALQESGFVHAARAYLLEGQELACVTAAGADDRLPLSRRDHPAVRALSGTFVTGYRDDGYVDFAAGLAGPPAPAAVLYAVLTEDTLDAQLLVRHLCQAASDRMLLLEPEAPQGVAHDGPQLSPVPRDLFERLIHEINNPLTAMLAHLEVLRLDRSDDSVVVDHVDVLTAQVERLAAILRAAGSSVRTLGGAGAHADIGRTLRAVAALVAPQYRPRRVELQVDIPHDLPSIRGSEAALQQAWLNYFHNAFKAICAKRPPGGCLRVKARHNRNLRQVVVEIADDGVGMDAETLASLTRRRADPGGPPHAIGTREAARIIAEHQGTIEFTSELGRGTTVRVTLPARETLCNPPLSGAERCAEAEPQ